MSLILPSIYIDLFSGKNQSRIPVTIPVISLGDHDARVSSFLERYQSQRTSNSHRPLSQNRHNKVVCRDILKVQNKDELFAFPCIIGVNTSLETYLNGKIYCIQDQSKESFMLAFEPPLNSKDIPCKSEFLKDDGYPEGTRSASFFSLSSSCLSLLVSEHGSIVTNSDGQSVLQGIEVFLLQTLHFERKSIFFKRKDTLVSPRSPLKEVGEVTKSVKINCFCQKKGFVYSTRIPVLTAIELKDKLKIYKAQRNVKYAGTRFSLKDCLDEKSFPEVQDPCSSQLIVFPDEMELDVPFGCCRGGELFFSTSEEDSSLCLLFLPNLLEKNSKARRRQKYGKNWHIKDSSPSSYFCITSRPSLISLSMSKLVPCSRCDYTIEGMNIELVSSMKGGSWAIFCSNEKGRASTGSPVPGPTGVRHHPYTSRGGIVTTLPLRPPASSTVSIPPERQRQQSQQGDTDSPVQGASGVSSYLYGTEPFSEGLYPLSPFPHCHHPYEQIGPSFPSLRDVVRPPFMALEPLSDDVPAQSSSATVQVGNIQQRPLRRTCSQPSICNPQEGTSQSSMNLSDQASMPTSGARKTKKRKTDQNQRQDQKKSAVNPLSSLQSEQSPMLLAPLKSSMIIHPAGGDSSLNLVPLQLSPLQLDLSQILNAVSESLNEFPSRDSEEIGPFDVDANESHSTANVEEARTQEELWLDINSLIENDSLIQKELQP